MESGSKPEMKGENKWFSVAAGRCNKFEITSRRDNMFALFSKLVLPPRGYNWEPICKRSCCLREFRNKSKGGDNKQKGLEGATMTSTTPFALWAAWEPSGE